MADSKTNANIWRVRQFRAYLSATAFSGMAFAMQQLLISWILVGILLLPADQVGVIQAIIGIPGVLLMLMGGASADRSDPRNLLIVIYLLAPFFPLFLIAMNMSGWFNVWTVTVWGLGVGIAQSYSTPAQQAILNRVAGSQIQQGVTAATAAGFIVQVVGLGFAGQIDRVGVAPVMWLQVVVLLLAGWAMTRVHKAPRAEGGPGPSYSPWQGIAEGLRAVYDNKVVLQLLIINFLSSIFNAGSFMTVFPFIVKRIYAGDAFDMSALMALFFAGAAVSNVVLLRFMPLAHPGRIYLLMQLTRIVVLLMFYVQGDWWLLILASLAWGLNMGITSNLARTIVQESAAPEFRGRILSVFSVGMLGSAPIGAIILGWLIESVGTLNALWPAMIMSFLLALYGILFTPIWHYRSAS